MSTPPGHVTAAAERQASRNEFRPETIHALIPGADPDRPAVFHTAGAVSAIPIRGGWHTAWAYVAHTGHYGLGKYPQMKGKAGDHIDLVTELRAVWNAIGRIITTRPVTVVTRSITVYNQLASWRDGSTTMPAGYTGSSTRTPTIEQLRRAIAAHPGHLNIREPRDTNPFDDAARALTDLAGRWARDNRTKTDITAAAARLAATAFTEISA